jgi:hypothetical protein
MLKRTAGFAAAILAIGGLHSVYTQIVAQNPQPAARAVTIEQVNRWETELSNWGRWGKDDQRGALNLVTPKKSVDAARLVKDGVTVSLSRFADLDKAADNFNFGETKHTMVSRDPNTGRVRGALDAISFGIHDGKLASRRAVSLRLASRRPATGVQRPPAGS